MERGGRGKERRRTSKLREGKEGKGRGVGRRGRAKRRREGPYDGNKSV